MTWTVTKPAAIRRMWTHLAAIELSASRLDNTERFYIALTSTQ